MVLIGFVTMFEDNASVANNRVNDDIVLDNNPVNVSPLPLVPPVTHTIIIPDASPLVETINQDATAPLITPPTLPNNPLNSIGGNSTNPNPWGASRNRWTYQACASTDTGDTTSYQVLSLPFHLHHSSDFWMRAIFKGYYLINYRVVKAAGYLANRFSLSLV